MTTTATRPSPDSRDTDEPRCEVCGDETRQICPLCTLSVHVFMHMKAGHPTYCYAEHRNHCEAR